MAAFGAPFLHAAVRFSIPLLNQREKGSKLLSPSSVSFQQFFKIGQMFFLFVQPLLLEKLLDFINSFCFGCETQMPAYYGYLNAVGLFVAAIFQTIFLQQYYHRCMTTGMRVRKPFFSSFSSFFSPFFIPSPFPIFSSGLNHGSFARRWLVRSTKSRFPCRMIPGSCPLLARW